MNPRGDATEIPHRNLDVGLISDHGTSVNGLSLLEGTADRLKTRLASRICTAGQLVDDGAIQPAEFLVLALVLRQGQSLRLVHFNYTGIRFPQQAGVGGITQVEAALQVDLRACEELLRA